MRNSIISILLFIILLGFLTYADISFKNLCTDIVDTCTEMEDNLKSNSKNENYEKYLKLYNLIDKQSAFASLYINHMDYDVILNEALKLTVYIETDDFSETEASLHLLKVTTAHMKELQIPNIKNIF